MPIRNALVIVVAFVTALACHTTAQRNHYASLVSEGMRIVRRFSLKELPERQLYEDAMNGMLSRLDTHSKYIGLERFETFQEDLDQEFGGIGILVEIHPEEKRLLVVSPLVGTPAYHAKIQSGDLIMSIEGKSTKDMSMADAIDLMRGKPATSVKLEIRHPTDATTTVLEVARAIIPVESVKGDRRTDDDAWNFLLSENPDVAYIRVESFGELTSTELRAALDSIRDIKLKGVIMDLRGNPGGLLSAAVTISDMFIEGGPIVSTRGRGGVVMREYDASGEVELSMKVPLVVMVNQYSASASEILAACLQDHERATIVGQRSFGKGTVQNIFEFENGRSALKLTTASYWRPSGVDIHRDREDKTDVIWGVRPDEGMEVLVDDEGLKKLVLDRRNRDIVPRQDGREVERDPLPPLLEIDSQLRAAVELLQKD
jgi:carboxyl-terminal processing protease